MEPDLSAKNYEVQFYVEYILAGKVETHLKQIEAFY